MDWRRLDLNGLKVLHALLLDHAVGRAAARLHITPSAVSHRLRALREDFGDPLFVRTPGGMEPTQRMRDLGVAVAAVVARLEEATGGDFIPGETRTEFCLVATDSVATALLPSLSRLLRVEAPGCGLRVSPYEGRDYTGDLLQGATDLVLSTGEHTPRAAGIGIEHLYEDGLLVLVGPRSAVWNVACLTEADYLDLPHVYSLAWPVAENGLDLLLVRDHQARRIVARVPNHAIAADIASATDLALTLPSQSMRHVCRGRADLRLFPCPLAWTGQVSLEWATEWATSDRARFLRSALARAVALAAEPCWP